MKQLDSFQAMKIKADINNRLIYYKGLSPLLLALWWHKVENGKTPQELLDLGLLRALRGRQERTCA